MNFSDNTEVSHLKKHYSLKKNSSCKYIILTDKQHYAINYIYINFLYTISIYTLYVFALFSVLRQITL